MTPKMKLFKWIDDFYTDDLKAGERLEFEKELKNNSEFRSEVELEKEIQSALIEKDIINLRLKIKEIIKTNPKSNGYFDLFEDFSSFEEFNVTVPPEELLDFYDSLPKVHLYHQSRIPEENVHHFYKEQNLSNEERDLVPDDICECEFTGIEEAVLEKDIIDLRAKLKRVQGLVNLPYSSVEIEKFVSGELSYDENELFRQELKINSALNREVEIYREVEKALAELDITNLRKRLSHLVNTETSWKVTGQQIEAFIDGELNGKELEEFKSEYNENNDLKSEVTLRENVNKAIAEQDIISLAAEIEKARTDSMAREAKAILPEKKEHKLSWWRVGAAVVIVLMMSTGLYNNI